MGRAAASSMPTMPAGIRAVLFDVDGTLYAQMPVRLRMAVEMALAGARAGSPTHGLRVARVIRAFRQIREELRAHEGPGLLDHLQYSRTAERLGVAGSTVREIVDEWMLRRPLRHVARARRPGIDDLLAALCGRGVRIGALSDYPARAKLEALGIARDFSLVLCTADPVINAFKPSPKGFLHACQLWGLAPEEVLYVGDRPEVDAAGAAAAGLRCVIVGSRWHGAGPLRRRAAGIAAFGDLARVFAS